MISEGSEIHLFEQDEVLCIMHNLHGIYYIKHEDPHYPGTYDIGTRFVDICTNTPAPPSELHESGGRFLDSLVDSMINRAFSSIENDELFWKFIKLFRSVRDWRNEFIELNQEMFKIANEDHTKICVRFTFDGEILTVHYDDIHGYRTPYEFSHNINTGVFIGRTPYTTDEGIVVVKGNGEDDEEEEDIDDNDESEDDE